jgi:hypothetical protein
VTRLIVREPQVTVVVSQQGPPGPPGPPGPAGGGGAHQMTMTAATALGGHRVVIADNTGKARYPDRTNTAHADAVVGLTITSALAGESVTVQTAGDVVEGSWSWTPGPVWIGDNGLLTQTPPTAGWLQLFGVATAPNRVVLAPRQSILLQ